MNPLAQNIQEAIVRQLDQYELELASFIPIPHRSDELTLKNTIRDVIEDSLGSAEPETYHFVFQVRNKKKTVDSLLGFDQAQKNHSESIYSGGGKFNIPFLIKNADLLFDAGEYILARNVYQTIRQSGENPALALYQLGRCFELEGKLEEAKMHYEESIAYHSNLDTYQRLSSLLIRQKKNQQAAEVLERALHLKDIHLDMKFELHKAAGNCWGYSKKNELAEKNYLQALQIRPNADDVRSNLGVLYLQMSKIHEAKRNFEDAIASNPRNHQAIAGLGSYAFLEGDKKVAHDFFAQSLEIELNYPHAIYYLTKCAYEIRSYAVAEKMLNKYIERMPIHANLLYSLAGLQFHLGKIEEASASAKRVMQLQPQHKGAAELLKMMQEALPQNLDSGNFYNNSRRNYDNGC